MNQFNRLVHIALLSWLVSCLRLTVSQETITSTDTQLVGIAVMLKPQVERKMQQVFEYYSPEKYAISTAYEQGEEFRVYHIKINLGEDQPALFLEANQYSSGDVELSGILPNFSKMAEVRVMGESSRALVLLLLKKWSDPDLRQYPTFDPQTYTSKKVSDGYDITVNVVVGSGQSQTIPIHLSGDAVQEDGTFMAESRILCELFIDRVGIEQQFGQRITTFVLIGYIIDNTSEDVPQYTAKVQIGNFDIISVVLLLSDGGGEPHVEYTYTCGTDNVPCGSPIPDVYKYYATVIATAPLANGNLLPSVVTAWNAQPSPPFTITLSTIKSVYVISLTISSPPPMGVDWQITTQLFLGEWTDGDQHTSTVTINKYSTGSITYPTISFP